MGFIDEIKESLAVSDFPNEPIYKAVLFGDRAGYFENVKSIKSYSKTSVELCLKRGGLRITGEELYVKKYCAGDLVVCGIIKSVERI